jgi:hypothetical protein
MKRTAVPKEPIVAVIRDPRDVTRDYYIPYSQAKSLYDQGKLGWDETNHTYCEMGESNA